MTPPTPNRDTRRAQQRIARQLARIDYALPGSVVQRFMRCGSPRCTRCKANPPQLHGPYWQWSRKIGGKTVSKLLSPEHVERYQPWLDNARRLHELVTELETLTIHTVERTEGWDR
jgi:hypothetical protein